MLSDKELDKYIRKIHGTIIKSLIERDRAFLRELIEKAINEEGKKENDETG